MLCTIAEIAVAHDSFRIIDRQASGTPIAAGINWQIVAIKCVVCKRDGRKKKQSRVRWAQNMNKD